MRISRKVALVYLLTLVPLIALGLGLLWQWYSAHIELVESDRLNNARLVATAFETFARDLSGASKALGEATLDSPPATRTPTRFTLMVNSFPLHFSAVLDREGRVVYSNDSRLLNRTISDPAIEQAGSGASLAIGTSRVLDGQVGFVLAQSLLDGSGEPTGVAVQFVDPERLARRLTRNALVGGGASIVDSSGTLVVLFERPEVALERQHWGDFEAVAAALAGREYIDDDWVFPLDGRRRIVAAVPVGRLGWEASSAIPYESAIAPFWQSLTIAVSIGLLTLIVSGTAAGVMARSLVWSVGALRRQSLAVGDRDAAPADIVMTGDELEEVSRVLQQTDAELRSYITALEAIGQAGRTLSSAIGSGRVEEAIVRAARELFGAHAVWVFLHDDREDVLRAAVWYSALSSVTPQVAIRPGQGVTGRVFLSGEMAIVPDTSAIADADWRDAATTHGIDELAEVPLERAGRPFGVLGIAAPGVGSWRPGGRDTGLLATFGNEVATVLENARLYENERLIADTLQQSLLTLPDSIPGIRFAPAYHSATQSARVGGDFYDLFEIDHKVGVVMGDVAGHGLDAAVLTSLVKNAVRAHADEPGKSPSEVVELTNELLVKESRPESFVTLFDAELDYENGSLTYCNAGHTTAVLLRTDGSVEPLPSTAMLVGAFAGVHFEQRTVPIAEKETLVLYTDGLTEARRGRELFGERRVMAYLAGLHDRDPEAVIDALLSEVMLFTEGELSDDLALLAVQVTGVARAS